MRPHKFDWYSVDWTKQICVIAKELGTTPSYVCKVRKERGFPQSPNDRKRTIPSKADAYRDEWDWSKQDIELAKQYNITRERVRQIRRKYSLPNARNHRKWTKEKVTASLMVWLGWTYHPASEDTDKGDGLGKLSFWTKGQKKTYDPGGYSLDFLIKP